MFFSISSIFSFFLGFIELLGDLFADLAIEEPLRPGEGIIVFAFLGGAGMMVASGTTIYEFPFSRLGAGIVISSRSGLSSFGDGSRDFVLIEEDFAGSEPSDSSFGSKIVTFFFIFGTITSLAGV